MRIVFFPLRCSEFHSKSLEERPLAGIETAIIYLSQELKLLGEEVFVISHRSSQEAGEPTYLSLKEALKLKIDLLVVVRDYQGLFVPFDAKKRAFWTGDAWDFPSTFGIGDNRVIEKIDVVFLASDWQKETFIKNAHLPKEKVFLLRNGIKEEYFKGSEERVRKRLIYTSAPGRGLKHLPAIYSDLCKKYSDIELHIFSGFDVYVYSWPPEESSYPLLDELSDLFVNLPRCYWHGNVLQKELAREYMRSSVWVYPSHFEETSCITAMEAQAAGCAIVTTDLAALKETVGDAGILIKGEAGSENYRKKFVEAVDDLVVDDNLFLDLSTKGKNRAKNFDWKMRAMEFMKQNFKL